MSVLSAFSPIRNLKLLFVPPKANLAALDGLRGLSMLMILCYHSFAIFAVMNPSVISLPDLVEACGWTWAWVWNFDKSVDIFLVLSGFLIASMLLKQVDQTGTIAMKRFYWNRFLRLSPVYYTCIALYAWMCFSGVIVGGNEDTLWANILYVNNFLDYERMAMNWTWSLAIEEQFYVIFPLFLLLVMKKAEHPVRWLWGAFFMSFVICFVVIVTDPLIRDTPGSALVRDHHLHAHHFTVLYDNLYTRYGSIVAGIIAAWYWRYHQDTVSAFFHTPRGHALLLVSVLVIVVLMFLPVLTTRFDGMRNFAVLYQTFARGIFASAICVLVLVSLGSTRTGRALRFTLGSRIFYPIAQLSYSMYLVHVLAVTAAASVVGQWVTKYPERYPWSPFEAIGVVYLLSLVVTVLLAMILYLLVERPIMNLRR
jgi:peptidoglycan/LPS O-acetylase OafA/YrhL